MKYVLAVCTHNAGRSQMLAAFLERHAPADIRAESAGQDPAPQIWPNHPSGAECGPRELVFPHDRVEAG
jgi:protein-tyrosine-phosphatase